MRKMRNSEDITIDDIRNAVSSLAVLGNGLQIVKTQRAEMILSVPIELNQDH